MSEAGERRVPGVPAPERCYRHPRRETYVHCVRCGRPICPDCMRPASVGFQCPDDVKMGAASIRQPRTRAGARAGQSRAYVTWSLIGLNVIVYLATALPAVHGINQPYTSDLFEKWQLLPHDVADHHSYYRLLTSAFLHVSVVHILFNMVALGFTGPYLERLLGWWRYLALYLLSALAGSVMVYVFGAPFAAVAGASGAIFGLFAAALLLVRELGLDPQWLIGTIVLNFIITFSVQDISKLGHVGGFLGGGLATIALVGIPWRRTRIAAPTQVAGLGAVLAVIVAAAIYRTITF